MNTLSDAAFLAFSTAETGAGSVATLPHE